MIDIKSAGFGTVVFMDVDGVVERAVIVSAYRDQSVGVTGRPSTVMFENLRLGRKPLTANSPVYASREDCEKSMTVEAPAPEGKTSK